jgi:DNA-binding SARP family transcriptional activator/tetratricopeptide (TPR) repeat protein
MRIDLLGALLVADDAGAAVHLPGARLRVLLAALALNADKPVNGDMLAEFMWDGAPPPGYVTTLRSHMMRLRRVLPATQIETLDTGYRLSAVELDLDVTEFEELCRQAGASLQAGAVEQACDTAGRALDLWRGEPLMDVPSQVLRDRVVPRLEQLRVQVLEDHAEAGLALGRHGRLVAPLRDLVRQYPLRERVHAQLMLALSRGGRQAEALDAYQDARRVLIEQLGIEPGAQLRRLHERILAEDETDLATPAQAKQSTSSAGPGASTPRQLPAAAGHFTGRSGELEWLTGLPALPDPARVGDTVVISAIDGMAGIGKTALAVHAAHRLADRFEGGQLFVDLHGYTQGHPPREPGQALEALLRALGVPPNQIPKDTEQCAALYRQRLTGTGTLIVLDNALNEAQVRPLLPGDPGCLVLVTSRRKLKGLDDARSLSLDLLPPQDAVVLLRAVAGADRIAVEDPLLGQVAALCGHLPLALRIAGALLRHRPALSLGHLAALLCDQRDRISVLSDGDRDLATVFDLSYRHLDQPHRLLLGRLGLVPGPDLDPYAAAALSDTDPGTATRWLEDLVDHNLLIAHAPSRYRMHDLIRAHAAALAVSLEREPERDAALGRLLHYYAHCAQTVSLLIARTPRHAPHGPAPAHAPEHHTPDTARAWLRTEHSNLDAAFTHAHTHTLDDHTIALAAGLAEILRSDGPWTRALEIHQTAADTAERQNQPAAHADALTNLGRVRYLTGDVPGAADALARALEICRRIGNSLGEANAVLYLGQVRHLTGDFPAAADAQQRALKIYRRIGNPLGEANALIDLGIVRHLTGDFPAAADAQERALKIYRQIGNSLGEANTLNNLGQVRHLTGDFPAAADAQQRALEIYRRIGDPLGEALALNDLGQVRQATGDYPAAADALVRALELYRRIGNRHGEAKSLTNLGQVRQSTGDVPAAADALVRALEIYRRIGNRNGEAWALNYYAATVAATGDRPRALALYQQALAMNRELNKPDDEAIALEGLGECHLTDGNTGPALTELRQALEIYQHLGMAPDVERVRTRLASLAEM